MIVDSKVVLIIRLLHAVLEISLVLLDIHPIREPFVYANAADGGLLDLL